jgi:hypothetical protein
MKKPADQVSDWLHSVIAKLPARIRAIYVEYTDAFTQQMIPIVCFNVFGFECLANGNLDPTNAYHVNELGEFTWEPEDDCLFQASDYSDTNWMSVLKEAAFSSRVQELAIARGIQFVIGEHDGVVYLVR